MTGYKNTLRNLTKLANTCRLCYTTEQLPASDRHFPPFELGAWIYEAERSGKVSAESEGIMKLYEFVASWETSKGTQIAYACCNATSKANAQGIIHMSVPFAIDLGQAKVYPYSPAKVTEITLCYFDENGVEHREKYSRA